MELLFPLYMIAFFFCMRIFMRYALLGERGTEFLRRSAEESGDYERVKKLRFLLIAVQLLSALLLIFLEAYGLLYHSVARNKYVGSNMQFTRRYGGALLIGVSAAFFLAATALRLRIRFKMREAERRGPAPLPEVFRVSYTKNPKRIDNLMLGVMFIVFLLWIPIGLIVSRYSSTSAGIILGAILLAILSILIGAVVEEHKRVCELLVLNRQGILDKNPRGSVGYILWRHIMEVRASDQEVSLTLTKTVPGYPGRHQVAVIRLDLTPVSGWTVGRMIERYRLQAKEDERQARLSDPEEEG